MSKIINMMNKGICNYKKKREVLSILIEETFYFDKIIKINKCVHCRKYKNIRKDYNYKHSHLL